MEFKVTAAFYSPTGGTQKACEGLTEELANPARYALLDLAQPGTPQPASFGPGDLVVFAGPVFAGRLPGPMIPALRACSGNGALAVAAAVYGNRAYDDALLELTDILTEQGFTVVAAAGLLARHSLVTDVAAGRPDWHDRHEYAAFAASIQKKIADGLRTVPEVPGNRPYKPWNKASFTPEVNDACVECGLCAAHCPVGAISMDDPREVNTDLCFGCMRCVFFCPEDARALAPAVASAFEQKLGPLAGVRKPNELFL